MSKVTIKVGDKEYEVDKEINNVLSYQRNIIGAADERLGLYSQGILEAIKFANKMKITDQFDKANEFLSLIEGAFPEYFETPKEKVN